LAQISESGRPASMISLARSGLSAANASVAFCAFALSISIASGQCAPKIAAARSASKLPRCEPRSTQPFPRSTIARSSAVPCSLMSK
jgi:hypothetical protein